MYDGHITPVPALRQAPMFMHRSAAPRIPPTTSKSSLVRIGPGSGSAASRRWSVIAGASTILPGFITLRGSNSALTSRIALVEVVAEDARG